MPKPPVPDWKIEEIEKWYADGNDMRTLASVADGLGLVPNTVRKYRDLALERRVADRLANPGKLQQKLVDHMDQLLHMADDAARKCADEDDLRGYAIFMQERRASALAAAKIAGLDRIGVTLSGPQGGAVEISLGSSMLEVLADVANDFQEQLPSRIEAIEAEVVD